NPPAHARAGVNARAPVEAAPPSLWASARAAARRVGERAARGVNAAGYAMRRIPRAGRVCFVLAFVNAAVWGIVVPPFQVPDEIAHFGYAQYVAEHGKPPPQGVRAQYSPEEQLTLENLDFFNVIGRPQMR